MISCYLCGEEVDVEFIEAHWGEDFLEDYGSDNGNLPCQACLERMIEEDFKY
jgi:hypothetical protein